MEMFNKNPDRYLTRLIFKLKMHEKDLTQGLIYGHYQV